MKKISKKQFLQDQWLGFMTGVSVFFSESYENFYDGEDIKTESTQEPVATDTPSPIEKTIPIMKNIVSGPSYIPPIFQDEWAAELWGQIRTQDELETYARHHIPLDLKKSSNFVFTDGNFQREIFLVGEAPGLDEDTQKKPFVGLSGQLLMLMLNAIGITRDDIRLLNTIFWRPPMNRPPLAHETAACLPIVYRCISLSNPKAIVFVGSTAYQALTGRKDAMKDVRGRWFTWTNPYDQKQIPAFVVFHPSFLIRSPTQKKKAWLDWCVFRKEL